MCYFACTSRHKQAPTVGDPPLPGAAWCLLAQPNAEKYKGKHTNFYSNWHKYNETTKNQGQRHKMPGRAVIQHPKKPHKIAQGPDKKSTSVAQKDPKTREVKRFLP